MASPWSPTVSMWINEIDMLLLGKTGNGKSSTGNSILFKNAFKTSNQSTSETAAIQTAWNNYTDVRSCNYCLKVIDGPGLADTNLNAQQDTKRAYLNMSKVLSECSSGIHAFLVVVRMGNRFTAEDKNALESLKNILGNDYLSQFGVVIVTGGDSLNQNPNKYVAFQEWCRAEHGDLQRVMQECKNRCVLFDNVTTNEAEKRWQLDILLMTVLRIKSENGNQRYSNEIFKTLKASHDKLLRECSLTKIKEEFRKQLSILQGEISKMATCNGANVQNVFGLLQKLIGQVEYEITVTPRLKALLGDLSVLKAHLENAQRWIHTRQSFQYFMSQAKGQILKMIKLASPPSDPTFLEQLCKYTGFPVAVAAIAATGFGAPVGILLAGVAGGGAASFGGFIAADQRRNEARY